jgi:hypothetical protein
MRSMWFPESGEPKKLQIDHQMPQPERAATTC